jgi:hypothetical protein
MGATTRKTSGFAFFATAAQPSLRENAIVSSVPTLVIVADAEPNRPAGELVGQMRDMQAGRRGVLLQTLELIQCQ